MKIIFFGTPEFAIPSLKILFQSEHSIEAVVTAPDRERGRGKKISFTPVKKFALEKNLNILQPEKLRDELFIDKLKEINADQFVIVAFRILPAEIFTMPSKGTFNLHASILPKYRGAAPIQWALINGEKETGVTTFFLKEKVDTGNIILQEKVEITDEDDLGSLHDKLSKCGAKVVLQTVNLIDSGNPNIVSQNDSLATKAPKITKDICRINWNKSAQEIRNLVRALSPYPCAYFTKNEKSYKLFKVLHEDMKNLSPGEIHQTKNEIYVGCSEGAIKILELQPEGRKRMTADEFLRGYRIT